MKITHIEEPIAFRKLLAGDGNVFVAIGKPALFDDEQDYYCPYCIEYQETKKFSYAGGADSVQALQLAMKKIAVDLADLSKKRRVEISWFSDMPGETGFEP
ncbi:MAG: hypothetical protein WD397_16915 [Wenzhouxiangellaceae bacterium]